jgi:hypothetical protein
MYVSFILVVIVAIAQVYLVIIAAGVCGIDGCY